VKLGARLDKDLLHRHMPHVSAPNLCSEWGSCDPVELFRAPVHSFVAEECQQIAFQLKRLSRGSQASGPTGGPRHSILVQLAMQARDPEPRTPLEAPTDPRTYTCDVILRPLPL
jgi:hypothetical protein